MSTRCALVLLVLSANLLAAPLQVHYRQPANAQDQFENYTLALLRLVLDKTRTSHGPYELIALPAGITRLRARRALIANKYANLVLEESAVTELAHLPDLEFVGFSIDKGLLGKRVCFVNPARAAAIERAENLTDLRAFTFGQGIGWVDTDILRANGLRTREISSYDSYYRMVAAGRVDLFCLGASQIQAELERNRDLVNLQLNQSFYLSYPLPRLFFVNRKSKGLADRLAQGLQQALADGSFEQLWQQHFAQALANINLTQRKKIQLSNPKLAQFTLAKGVGHFAQ